MIICYIMRDLKHLKSNAAKLAQDLKEKALFRSQRKAVNTGANGTLEYTIKEGVNKSKIADAELIKNKNQVLDRSLILNKLWNSDDFFAARSMDVFISKLRKKLSKDEHIQIINVRGFGYKLTC